MTNDLPDVEAVQDSIGYVTLLMPVFHHIIRSIARMDWRTQRELVQQLVQDVSSPQARTMNDFFTRVGPYIDLGYWTLDCDKTPIFGFGQARRLLDLVEVDVPAYDRLVVSIEGLRATYALLVKWYPPDNPVGVAFWQNVANRCYVQLPGWAHPAIQPQQESQEGERLL